MKHYSCRIARHKSLLMRRRERLHKAMSKEMFTITTIIVCLGHNLMAVDIFLPTMLSVSNISLFALRHNDFISVKF